MHIIQFHPINEIFAVKEHSFIVSPIQCWSLKSLYYSFSIYVFMFTDSIFIESIFNLHFYDSSFALSVCKKRSKVSRCGMNSSVWRYYKALLPESNDFHFHPWSTSSFLKTNVQQGVLVRYHSKEMTYFPIFKRFGKQKIILYESFLFIFVHQTKTDRGRVKLRAQSLYQPFY